MLQPRAVLLVAVLTVTCFASATDSAVASVTLLFGNRLVQTAQDGVVVQDFDQDTGTSGVFAESASIDVPDSGVNGYGSLFAEQNSNINALNWSGTGGVAIDGHDPLRSVTLFGGQATSLFQIIFEVTCPTVFSLEGKLNELVDGGDAVASFQLSEFAVSDLFDISSTGGGEVSVSESELLAPGNYVFTAKAFAIGDPGTNFFDRANFQFDVTLEEQCVVPEPGSVAVWSLIGLTFVGASRIRRRGASAS